MARASGMMSGTPPGSEPYAASAERSAGEKSVAEKLRTAVE